MNIKLLAIPLLICIAGCGGPKTIGGSPNLKVSSADALPPPTRADLLSMDRPYMIGSYDKLSIDVFGVEELSKKDIQADASGRISMPLVGELEAAGKTPAELARLIEDRLRGRYIRDPQVTVNLTETVSQVMTVDGEVKKPGLYPVIGRMTLVRAVATAEGTTEFARLRHVVIFRTVAGQRMAALYNLQAIRNGRYDDPEVFANDVVQVGDLQAKRVFKDVLQLAPALSTPLVYLLDNR